MTKQLRVVNHRGFNSTAPENTLEAFALSKEKGYKYVETDVSFTSDGVPVLLHDPTINRVARNLDGSTIAGEVKISDITYKEAYENYNFSNGKAGYENTKIAGFEDFLRLCKREGLYPYIELKANGGYTEEKVKMLVQMVNDYGLGNQSTWISFTAQYLNWVKTYASSATLGFLVSANGVNNGAIFTAQQLKTATNTVSLDVNYKASATAAALCESAGIPLEVWTVDKVEIVKTLPYYVSSVTTNVLQGILSLTK